MNETKTMRETADRLEQTAEEALNRALKILEGICGENQVQPEANPERPGILPALERAEETLENACGALKEIAERMGIAC